MLSAYEPHWAAVFPIPTGKVEELAADIAEQGLLHDIVRMRVSLGPRKWEWRTLDGIIRERACILAKVQPRYVEYAGDDPVRYVLSANKHRRHLSNESQRAIVAARLKLLGRGRPRKSGSYAELSKREAGHLLNVGERAIGDAKAVLAKGTPELVSAVEQGELAVTAAAELAKLPKRQQREVLAKTPKSEVRAVAREETSAPPITKAVRLSESDQVALHALAEVGATSRDPRARAGVVVLRRIVPLLEVRR